MNVTAIKTSPIIAGDSLFSVIDEYVPKIGENEILVVTSKIVSICEGRIVKADSIPKADLIKKEASQYIEKDVSKYGIWLTIKNHTLIASAGIDESNGNGYYILWPENPMASAQKIWEHLRKKHKRNHLGVIITDSTAMPLRWGTRGIGIAWCGFKALKNYIGEPDIFGRNLRVTKASIIDGLSGAAVVIMGEGDERQPLAKITEVPFIEFETKPPSKEEAKALQITIDEDLFAPLLTSSKWKKGETP